jgi:hypothetical protein
MLRVLMLRTCYTHGICTLLVSVDAQVLCIACSIRIWRRQFGAIPNHSERKPCRNLEDYSANRIEIVIKVLIEFAAAIRAFAAKLVQRQLEPSLLDSQRTKSPLVNVQRQLKSLLLDFWRTVLARTILASLEIGRVRAENKKCTQKRARLFFSRAP